MGGEMEERQRYEVRMNKRDPEGRGQRAEGEGKWCGI